MFGENKYSFSEKWEAQAFVIICHLNEIGFIDWPEWTELFSKHLELRKIKTEIPEEDTYYLSWLAAAKEILINKGIVTSEELTKKLQQIRQNDADEHS